MKVCPSLALACSLLAARCAPGQGLDVSLRLDNGVYIEGEPVRATLQLVNRTAGDFCTRPPLCDDRLLVEVGSGLHDLLAPLPAGAGVEPLTVIAGNTWTGVLALDRSFPLRKPGRYFATLVAIQEDRRYASVRRAFDVVPGLELKSALQLFSRASIRSRRFSLVYWARNQQEFLFLKMEDDPLELTWETIRLGALLRVSEPRIDVAPDGMITVLHRVTQDAYLKTRVRSQPDAVEVVSQEQLLDPSASMRQHMEPFQRMAVERRVEENLKPKRNWWWPFGGSGSGKNGG